MKKLSRNEWIGASVAVLFVAYMFFGAETMSFLGEWSNDTSSQSATAMNSGGPTVSAQDIVVGGGLAIEPGMEVSVNYVLKLADGTVIQDSKLVGNGEPFKFIAGAGQLIPGWEQGILGMKVGSTRVITMPPELAYGSQTVGPIPANSTLIFEIQVVSAGIPAQ